MHKVNSKLKEKPGVKISYSVNISASNWATELRKKESTWPTYIGQRPFPKLYLSQFFFKTGLRKIKHWIKGYIIKSSIFVWFSITWASWKQNYQGKLFICLNFIWEPYRLQKNKPIVNWKKQGFISILVVTLASNSITIFSANV